MTDFQFSIIFDKFQADEQIINISPEIHIVYGESGVGKSDFLSCINSESHSHLNNFKIKSKISGLNIYRIYQNPDHQIIGKTVRSELSFTGECEGKSIEELKKLIELGFEKLPKSIEATINPALLSGGEKELLNLTTALQMNPDILLIDDGLSFLSLENKKMALNWLNDWCNNSSAIIIWTTSEKKDLELGYKNWFLGLDSFATIENSSSNSYDLIQIPDGDLSLDFSHVSFNYESSRQIYSDFSISLKNARSIGISGGNGSGKTTFAALCFAYLKPISGQVSLILGENSNLKIGYVDQFPEHLIQLKTPAEFLDTLNQNGIFDSQLNNTFKKRLTRFGIQWEQVEFIQGINLPWSVLRMILIVVLCHSKFDIIILDEPTFGLGWNQRVILRSFLRECMTKMHFIIVSHDDLFIQSTCDQIINLDLQNQVEKKFETEKES
ncbi:MAG: ATP-binding cassette domain-containing protein [Candidatus Marinimicrobia bacterium]|nr:ATP-binding cassette domain-containing protein [Candidatus Neomarinimicrobiota bacterium]MBT3501447.1 ATP-binding cassette domain-containing protein [Candidatus Neomarinimicrobiota bacterium]MBT3839414.1 ATP-binding cassette domain-containing protein [Candidatus Neomarinimicrobiota bacterium]MBT3998601.1 ATP-binding cassette domain-containing protein [Candidatus Neomarinimicrobiota bacterium]MBT4283073.1 ATP-binding cassette domain-containing protein [Candidatus Neomarinimicrobiota bacterium